MKAGQRLEDDECVGGDDLAELCRHCAVGAPEEESAAENSFGAGQGRRRGRLAHSDRCCGGGTPLPAAAPAAAVPGVGTAAEQAYRGVVRSGAAAGGGSMRASFESERVLPNANFTPAAAGDRGATGTMPSGGQSPPEQPNQPTPTRSGARPGERRRASMTITAAPVREQFQRSISPVYVNRLFMSRSTNSMEPGEAGAAAYRVG
ncbi:hypothetical protein GCM10010123_25320 [Pilimelia anulata]|uniref:Uncharacterized protein n=1 Tax=Pilimelia anulata TaxID=53371 RepID=A0A8J3B568_9ACTN|nr:hypothetical protein GCM10010123_25320 [Pilimelia anulata]